MSSGAVTVLPAIRAGGRVAVPGDKSISHRYALLAALADGQSTIDGYSAGADCAATLGCVQRLGVRIERPEGSRLVVAGRGLRGLQATSDTLDAANSGTTTRLLAGVLAAHTFQTTITGDASLARRPMRRVIEPLERMGARVESCDGRLPLVIHGAPLQGIAHVPEVPSAQVKSSVLLAGLQAEGTTSVLEPAPTRDHTERALCEFGVDVDVRPGGITVRGGQRLAARRLIVPGDVSSAAFWCVLAAGTPGAVIEIEGVGLNPTRTAFLDVLRRAGADVDVRLQAETAGEPVGSIRVAYGVPCGFEITPGEVPGVIDEIPALAALGAMLPEGETMRVSGAAELRVKESDRISALAAGLRALGAHVDELPDGFVLGARPLRGANVDASGDHRLAMAFALTATRAPGPSRISGARVVDVSYPGFFEDLARLTSR